MHLILDINWGAYAGWANALQPHLPLSPTVTFSPPVLAFPHIQHLHTLSHTNIHTANITVGRLGALLAYAYHLCKHYIKMNAKVNLVVTFLGIVTTWLFRFLIKAKFYEWLESMGGWVSGIMQRVMCVYGFMSECGLWVYGNGGMDK